MEVANSSRYLGRLVYGVAVGPLIIWAMHKSMHHILTYLVVPLILYNILGMVHAHDTLGLAKATIQTVMYTVL